MLWEDGNVLDLGTLGGNETRASDINDEGQVVGYSRNSDGHLRAFLWQDGVMTDLGTLGNREHAGASGINNRGQVVGSSFFAGLGWEQFPHAFLWQDGVMTDLGTLDGRSESNANHINDHSEIVGWSGDYSGNQRAVMWEDCSVHDPSSPLVSKAGAGNSVAVDRFRFDAVMASPSSPEGVQFIYEVPATTGPLDIKVYDVAGRLIAEPFLGARSQRTGSVHWDGIDSRGCHVPAGIYFAQLQMDGHSLVKRLMLTR